MSAAGDNRNILRRIAHRAMLERGLEPDFSRDALEQLNSIHEAAPPDGRVANLRQLPWCSIDNDDSRDLDQLTVVQDGPNGTTRVLVAIADVDAVVPAGSPIDRHAQKNTTSVYTAAQIFPMLPEKLSIDLTSLGEGEDRLAVVTEIAVAADGSASGGKIYRALVHNQAKLAYPSVGAWLDGHGERPAKVTAARGMDEQLRRQNRIAQGLVKLRFEQGALDLETIEPRAVLRDGHLVGLVQEPRNAAMELIAELMIAANEVVANFLADRGWPSLRRIVRTPKRWDRIVAIAAGFGETLPAQADGRALSDFLRKRRTADPLRFPDLSVTIVKLLGRGEYVLEPPGGRSAGHFGLAIHDYTHSTAPNRRFPDVITQRLLKAAIAGEPIPYRNEELEALAKHCTEQEDAANKVERRVRKSAAALLLSDRLGEKFDALVTGTTAAGTWVRLLAPPVEGKLVAGAGGLDVGDPLTVRLVSVDVEQGFIDFERLKG